ncbi:hypothetical protein [uncultured Pedobacter sp.]|uniref:hypothetical protein n=1 Tax=uncultured Pedobacter sp. TaxID=246139 RepID=UPI0025DEEEF6|nr:hypothetical protein [uncultured Pedobacter sp.]
MKLLCIFLVTMLISLIAFAQGSASGCLLPDNKVYTSYTELAGLKLYSSSSSASLSSNYCSWTSASTVPCSVCFGTINAVGLLCVGGTTVNGREGIFTMVECDLDDQTWLFGAAASLFGIFLIRKKE